MGVLVGLFVGTRESLLPVMLIDLVGLSKMTNCISVNSVVSTFSIAVHNPILGYVVQKTGSFRLVLHYVGGTLFASAVGLFVIPLVQRLDKKSDSGQIDSSEVFVPGSNPPLPRDNSGRLKS
uniref:Major facilitator superfamily (MFS) profile domain-containing protein n=1 Tax=Biomphalaria glabrata TaxID=6526 RepID=A0A2C9L337_BIOGL